MLLIEYMPDGFSHGTFGDLVEVIGPSKTFALIFMHCERRLAVKTILPTLKRDAEEICIQETTDCIKLIERLADGEDIPEQELFKTHDAAYATKYAISSAVAALSALSTDNAEAVAARINRAVTRARWVGNIAEKQRQIEDIQSFFPKFNHGV